jgi:hypothetical protein
MAQTKNRHMALLYGELRQDTVLLDPYVPV